MAHGKNNNKLMSHHQKIIQLSHGTWKEKLQKKKKKIKRSSPKNYSVLTSHGNRKRSPIYLASTKKLFSHRMSHTHTHTKKILPKINESSPKHYSIKTLQK